MPGQQRQKEEQKLEKGAVCQPFGPPGRGADPFAGGVSFHILAPNAGQVFVAGLVNDGSKLE